MKIKFFAIVFLVAGSIICGQSSDKGRISFTFNDEKIDLPINMVSLRKENFVILTARAEKNTEYAQQLISMELSFKQLSTEDKDLNIYESFLIEVKSQKKNPSSREEVLLRMFNNADDGELTVFHNNKFIHGNAFSLKLNISKVAFENNTLIIDGNFDLKVRSTESDDPETPVAEIKDCKFEIII